MEDDFVEASGCGNCLYWSYNEHIGGRDGMMNNNPWPCLLHAPIAAKKDGEVIWPETEAHDWCGDYARIIEDLA